MEDTGTIDIRIGMVWRSSNFGKLRKRWPTLCPLAAVTKGVANNGAPGSCNRSRRRIGAHERRTILECRVEQTIANANAASIRSSEIFPANHSAHRRVGNTTRGPKLSYFVGLACAARHSHRGTLISRRTWINSRLLTENESLQLLYFSDQGEITSQRKP